MKRLVPLVLAALTACFDPLADGEVEDAGPNEDAGFVTAYACNPGTCQGCCEGKFCRAGNLENLCGTAGAACSACAADAFCSEKNTCEKKDPAAYGSEGPKHAPISAGQTCRSFGNSWVCW